ncbi:Imm50 family immunity protein [Streptomyces wuyuanensis]|uniref:Imm50 family immunity protein n=1 Tax=Streptomyces wuyuanensis TaxID=1196353 RepID=UPI00371AA571
MRPLDWADHVPNGARLKALYGTLPPLRQVIVRSLYLDHFGPSLTLRLDLPEFPRNHPAEWDEAGLDRFQCHLQFLAVAGLALEGWIPGARADIELEGHGRSTVRVRIESEGFRVSFEASDSILVGHMSAFRGGADGSDSGPRRFIGQLDSKRFGELPEVYEKTFYGHI